MLVMFYYEPISDSVTPERLWDICLKNGVVEPDFGIPVIRAFPADTVKHAVMSGLFAESCPSPMEIHLLDLADDQMIAYNQASRLMKLRDRASVPGYSEFSEGHVPVCERGYLIKDIHTAMKHETAVFYPHALSRYLISGGPESLCPVNNTGIELPEPEISTSHMLGHICHALLGSENETHMRRAFPGISENEFLDMLTDYRRQVHNMLFSISFLPWWLKCMTEDYIAGQ